MKLLLLMTLICSVMAAPRSVWDGVFSKEQVNRGQSAYNSQCARCHGESLLGGENSPPLADKDFLERWSGKPVGSLVELTKRTMPSDGPGKLSRRQVTDIAAFILNANGFPAGKGDLDTDADVQNEILIEKKPQ